MTPLCEIAYKYGTDKCPDIKHNYTPYYYNLLKDRRKTVKKVLEMGIGYQENIKYGKDTWNSQTKRKYHKGASLKMWRDFFPNAQIYGADIKEETMFKDERIETFVCDERKYTHIKNLLKKTGTDIDLFIDDGSHMTSNQIRLAKYVVPLLDKGATYIIEDVGRPSYVRRNLKEFETFIPRLGGEHTKKDRLITVKKYIDDNLVVINK